jgi:DNA adenine methylase
VPLSNTANFTKYHVAGFSMVQQQQLADLARGLVLKGIPVLISNHSHALTQNLYAGANITELEVNRLISCQANNRQKVKELLALFKMGS